MIKLRTAALHLGFWVEKLQLSDPSDDFPYLLERICVLLVNLREGVECFRSALLESLILIFLPTKDALCWRTRIWGAESSNSSYP